MPPAPLSLRPLARRISVWSGPVNSALGKCEQTYRMKNQLVTPPVMLCRMSRCKSRALPATFQPIHKTLYSRVFPAETWWTGHMRYLQFNQAIQQSIQDQVADFAQRLRKFTKARGGPLQNTFWMLTLQGSNSNKSLDNLPPSLKLSLQDIRWVDAPKLLNTSEKILIGTKVIF